MLMTAMVGGGGDVPLYPATDFCGMSQQFLTLDYIPETPWNPITFLTEIKVKVPIESNTGFGEDLGGEMRLGKALLSGWTPWRWGYGNRADFDYKAGDFHVALSVFSIMAAKALCSRDCKNKERNREQSESGEIPGVFLSVGFHAGARDRRGEQGVVSLKEIRFIGTLWITC